MIKEILKSHLTPREEYLYGFADLQGLTDPVFRNFRYGISIGKKLDNSIVATIYNGPTTEFLSHYLKVNHDLEQVAGRIKSSLRENHIEAVIIKPSGTATPWEAWKANVVQAEILHSLVAARAGLGWIGKTGLLVTRIFGPRIRFVTLLTNYRLEPESKPYEMSECGDCRICVFNCPAKAANGKPWNILVDRGKFLDEEKCYNMCKEFGEGRFNGNHTICRICMAVCPVGK